MRQQLRTDATPRRQILQAGAVGAGAAVLAGLNTRRASGLRPRHGAHGDDDASADVLRFAGADPESRGQ
jgi:hypothetical protein